MVFEQFLNSQKFSLHCGIHRYTAQSRVSIFPQLGNGDKHLELDTIAQGKPLSIFLFNPGKNNLNRDGVEIKTISIGHIFYFTCKACKKHFPSLVPFNLSLFYNCLYILDSFKESFIIKTPFAKTDFLQKKICTEQHTGSLYFSLMFFANSTHIRLCFTSCVHKQILPIFQLRMSR